MRGQPHTGPPLPHLLATSRARRAASPGPAGPARLGSESRPRPQPPYPAGVCVGRRSGAMTGGMPPLVALDWLGRRTFRMPESRPRTRFIFVTGGGVSPLRQGIAAPPLGPPLLSPGPEGAPPEVGPRLHNHPRPLSPLPPRPGVVADGGG